LRGDIGAAMVACDARSRGKRTERPTSASNAFRSGLLTGRAAPLCWRPLPEQLPQSEAVTRKGLGSGVGGLGGALSLGVLGLAIWERDGESGYADNGSKIPGTNSVLEAHPLSKCQAKLDCLMTDGDVNTWEAAPGWTATYAVSNSLFGPA